MTTSESRFDKVDRRITGLMATYGVLFLRVALGVVFLWFGALKLIPGLSPAEDLVGRTVEALTFGIVPASVAVPVLALWEVAIGVGFLVGRWMRVTLLLLFVQMAGTVTPLFLFPSEMFVRVALLSAVGPQSIKLPASAIVTEGLYSSVFVESAPHAFAKRRITLGLQTADSVYVREGLRAGEAVVTQGALLLDSELAAAD